MRCIFEIMFYLDRKTFIIYKFVDILRLEYGNVIWLYKV